MVSEAGVARDSEKITILSEWSKPPKMYRDLKCYYRWPCEEKKDVATLCRHVRLVRWSKQNINYLWDYTIYFFQIGNEIC